MASQAWVVERATPFLKKKNEMGAKATYAGVIPNISDKKMWPQVDKGFKLLPPMAKKRGVGRQRKNRISFALEKGKGKATRQVHVSNDVLQEEEHEDKNKGWKKEGKGCIWCTSNNSKNESSCS
ncbi:hypothetical protein E2562_024100 [Oryza meyeriana var. granulata]|uniref:Uncharacterized protein n=1 Tax=Oryza meyeriana var. granulata TaxID=110450 RepID=A0A6G1CJJ0_9ORYZ|nr:hypothetical protein E2562_024100 [Oryza meyeriana var. granulata]